MISCTNVQKLIRDYSIEHNDDFKKPIKISKDCWKKALESLANPNKGPFCEITPGSVLFVKKKRDLNKLEMRIKYTLFINHLLLILGHLIYTKIKHYAN